MQDPNFEKQVQQKLDELKFSPSPAVWAGVDGELNKEKKRRRAAWWLFPLAALPLCAIGYLTWNSFNRRQTNLKTQESASINAQATAPKTGLTATTAPLHPAKGGRPPAAGALQSKPVDTIAANDNRQTNAVDRNEVKGGVPLPTVKNKQRNGVGDRYEKLKEKTAPGEKPAYDLAVAADRLQDENLPTTDGLDKSTVSSNLEDTISSKPSPAAVSKSTDKRTSLDSTAVKATAKISNQKKNRSSSIKFGLTSGAGISATPQNLFHSRGVTYSAPAANPGSSATAGSPSPVKTSFSFYGGFILSKSIKPRISISAGLNYHLYTTSMTTGAGVDSLVFVPSQNTFPSLVNGYYRSGSATKYVNRYQFLELPVAIDLQLNRGKKVPLLWELGVSVARLLSTNALQYDPVNGIYYKNNEAFNKTQLHFTTSLLAEFHIAKSALQLGPQFQYGATGLLNKNAAAREHLLFTGIRLVFIEGKN